ncbi:hypothetical protein LLS1_11430 [Leifsonia sp. LS1]|uniref:ribosomal maturation YjgA family protein n=1 Tax=Leifsonia sp. LS1 TaxID=2828483 RepID=UPI001CFDAD5B|nr:DUF2809 domain-containing protein [Leifsonia sp. LS1]GIT79474.1 hypothetical protein LLS1_11430 [Leifsonia sp. LS1]
MRRLVLLILAVLVIAAGLAVHIATSGEPGGFVGDALYAVLVFLLAALVAPRASVLLTGGAALALCWGVELLQLTGIPAVLSRSVPGASLALGTTFEALDLVAYTVGVGTAVSVDALIRRAAGSCRGGPTTPSAGAPGSHRPEGTPSR